MTTIYAGFSKFVNEFLMSHENRMSRAEVLGGGSLSRDLIGSVFVFSAC